MPDDTVSGQPDPSRSPNPETRGTDLADGSQSQRYVDGTAADGDDGVDLPFDHTTREDDQGTSITEGWRQHPRIIAAFGLFLGSVLLALALGLIPFFPSLTNPMVWIPTVVVAWTAGAIHFGTKSERSRRKRDTWGLFNLNDEGYSLRGSVEQDGLGGYVFTPIRGYRKAGYEGVELKVKDVKPALANTQGKAVEPDDPATIAVAKGLAQLDQTEDFGTSLLVEGGTLDIAENHPTATLKVTFPERASMSTIRSMAYNLNIMRNIIAELRQSRQSFRRRARQAEFRSRERHEEIRDELHEDLTKILESLPTYQAGPQQNGQHNQQVRTGDFQNRLENRRNDQ